MTNPFHSKRFLSISGSGLTIAGFLGLGLSLWFGGLNPSLWFIITAGGTGRHQAISGWTITATFCGALIVGLFLLALARRQIRLSR